MLWNTLEPTFWNQQLGREDVVNWRNWRWIFRAGIIFVDPMSELELDHAERSNTEITVKPDAPEAETRSKRLFAILSSILAKANQRDFMSRSPIGMAMGPGE